MNILLCPAFLLLPLISQTFEFFFFNARWCFFFVFLLPKWIPVPKHFLYLSLPPPHPTAASPFSPYTSWFSSSHRFTIWGCDLLILLLPLSLMSNFWGGSDSFRQVLRRQQPNEWIWISSAVEPTQVTTVYRFCVKKLRALLKSTFQSFQTPKEQENILNNPSFRCLKPPLSLICWETPHMTLKRVWLSVRVYSSQRVSSEQTGIKKGSCHRIYTNFITFF